MALRTSAALLLALIAGCLAGVVLFDSGPFGYAFLWLPLAAIAALTAAVGRPGSELTVGLVANLAMTGTVWVRHYAYYLGLGRLDIFRESVPALLGWSAASVVASLAVALYLRNVRRGDR